MEPSELVKQPQDVTENPYRLAAKDKNSKQLRTNLSHTEEEQVTTTSCRSSAAAAAAPAADLHLPLVQEPTAQFFFDLGRKQGGGRDQRGRGGAKRHWDGGGRGRDGDGQHRTQQEAKQPRRPRK